MSLIDDIKVEVALPIAEGDNLITNTSGQYGAWQYQPGHWRYMFFTVAIQGQVTGVTITGDPVARTVKIQRGASADSSVLGVDHVPVTPGKYFSARTEIVSITAGHSATMIVAWMDSSHNWLEGEGTVGDTATTGAIGVSSVVPPADAAFAEINIVVHPTGEDPLDAPPAAANSQLTVTRTMVTELSDPGSPSVVSTNLIPNPSFETVATGWSAGTNIGTVARVTSDGRNCLRASFKSGTSLSNMERSFVNGPTVAVTAGARYSIHVEHFQPPTLAPTGHNFRVLLLYRWYAGGVQVGPDHLIIPGSSGLTESAWIDLSDNVLAPAGATSLRVYPGIQHEGPTLTRGTSHYWQVDQVAVVESLRIEPYFDGATPDTATATYAWTGTAGNSTSTRTSVGPIPYDEPDDAWTEVTGGYSNLVIERSELDVETMSGTIVDPELSPVRASSLINPGRRIRVSGYDPAISDYRRLFTGTLGPCGVDYDPLRDTQRNKVKINVTATGNTSLLAQASRPDVVLTAAGLPWSSLAGAGVPWNVDGSTAITPSTSVADSDSATGLDQVALTRDTVGGLAWVDPNGTLWFQTTPGAKSTGPATMGPEDYTASGLKVSFSTERMINSVSVTRLIRASDGSTEERQAGQTYEDGPSIHRWGRRSASVTIASLPNDVNDARVAAERILAANATPAVRVEQVTVNSADNRTHSFHDLYDLIAVTAETIDGTVDTPNRVVSVRHEINTERRPGAIGRWFTTYGFMADGGVASPAIQPPLASAAAQPRKWAAYSTASNPVPSGSWTTISGYATAFPGFSSAEIVSADVQPFTYGSGVITAQVNGWIRVHFMVEFANNSSGRRGIKVRMNSIGPGGSNAPSANFQSALSASPLPLETFYSGPIAAEQTLTTEVYQDSGGSLNLLHRSLTIEMEPLA